MRFFVLLWLSACGYTTAQSQHFPGGVTRVYVNQAMDNGTDVGPAATLTRVLRERIDASRHVRLVPLEQAEVVLEARIESSRDLLGALAVGTATPTVPKYSLVMSGLARLINKRAVVVWEVGGVNVTEDYLSGTINCGTVDGVQQVCSDGLREASIPVTESNRRRALERAAAQLADAIYTRLISDF